MRPYIPDNSRRSSGTGLQSRVLKRPEENSVKSSNIGRRSQSAEVEKSGSKSEPEFESGSHRQQEFGQTGAGLTSEEIDAMPREDLVRTLKALQKGRIDHKTSEESRDHTPDEPHGNPNAKTSADLTDHERRNAVLTHARKSFLVLTNMDNSSVRPTVKNADGTIQYWGKNEQGINVLTPAWEEGCLTNLKVWKGNFLDQCRLEEDMPALTRDYLKTVSDDAFVKALKEGVWKTYSGYGRQAAKGTFKNSQAHKNQQNRENNRRATKSTQRVNASRGTCVDSNLPEFAFLYRPRAQSLPVPDKSNPNREVVLVPSFISDKVLAIKESLDLKAKSKSVKPQVYLRVDVPVTKLDGEYSWSDWAISEAWKRDHLDEYNKSKHLIDPDRTVMPNVSELTKRYHTQHRTYLPSMPSGVQLPNDAIHWSNEDSTSPALDATEESQVCAELPLQPLPPPPPLATPEAAVHSPGPREHQLNGGHYVNGEFIDAPSIPHPSSTCAVTQGVFGIPIDPKASEPVAGPSTSSQKRVAEGSKTVAKRQKKGDTTEPPRRSTRLQNAQVDHDGEEEVVKGNTRKLVLKVAHK